MTTKSKIKNYGFSTLDIETGKKGNVLAIRIFNEKYQFTTFYSWMEFYEFLFINNDIKEYTTFIAHNGGGFDYISMIDALMPVTVGFSVILGGSKIISVTMTDLKKKVKFLDSYLVLTGSLKNLSKTFKIETPKGDIEIEKIEHIFKHDRKRFDKYLDADCVSLYQICNKFMYLMNVKSFPMTIASFSMKQFKKKFVRKGKKGKELNFFNTETARVEEKPFFEMFDQCYGGGRVEVFRPGSFDMVRSYDVNSLYPFVMANNYYPTGTTQLIYGKPKERIDEDGNKTSDFAILPVKFTQTDKTIPPFFWEKTDNGMEFLYSGSGVYTSVEIEAAKEYGIDMEIGSGIVFLNDKYKMFESFVDHFYTLRMENKDNALNVICKFILNSLYGKFAESGDGEEFCHLTYNELEKLIIDGVGFAIYSEKLHMYRVEKYRHIKHAQKYISAFTTAYARIYMFKFLVEYKKQIVYMDTDSIHITGKMADKYLGNELGQFKIEAEGKANYVGRKMYEIGNKKKMKGVRNSGSLFHDDIKTEDFLALLEKIPITKSFNTFPAFKSVAKGALPCKQITLTKTIHPPTYTSNFNNN